MSVVKTYWALSEEASVPFEQMACHYNVNRFQAYLELQEKVGCDSINTNTNGSILLSYNEKQDQPWLTKRPAYTAGGMYHYFPKAKTPQYDWVKKAREKTKEVPEFQAYCKEQFPDSEVSILGEAQSGSGFALYRTAFGVLKGQLVMVFPVLVEDPDYSKVPAGFVELTNSQYAALNKDTEDDPRSE